RVTINGSAAEDVMYRECTKADQAEDVTVKKDYYLGYLYKIRISRVNEIEESLISRRMYASSQEERDAIDKKLSSLCDYKVKMRNKLEEL
ncbi:MAG: hypothetical protein Q3987_09580, partial [Oscillospiraceae bacterium]|nr:hypothetical protein [Oscillospiraceae bacterium]